MRVNDSSGDDERKGVALKELEHALTTVRIVNASIEAVYAAWTEPTRMRAWLATHVDADVRVGGKYRITVDEADGSHNSFAGEYLVLEPPHRIVKTFSHDESPSRGILDERLEVTLRALGSKRTELTLVDAWSGDALGAEERLGGLKGWSEWVDLLEKTFPPGDTIEVVVTKRFSVSAERVFDAWLDPAKLDGFLFGRALRDERIVRLSVDARVGGGFSFVVERDGEQLDHVGDYLEILRPYRLAFTWDIGERTYESHVVVDIARREAGSELTLRHRMHQKWRDYAERTREGWTTMIDALAARFDATSGA